MSKAVKDAVWKWEDNNLINYNGYVLKGGRSSVSDNMSNRGYDAMRISPQVTEKYGLQYRAVYGATIEPDYTRPQVGGKYHPKVQWYKQGYIKAGTAKGTTVFRRYGGMFIKEELDDKLMIKKARR